jgi:hypothetical protein
MENFSQGAEWTTRYKNNLPDSAFLYIEAGGKKDSEGKIKPRSLRHFPYKDADGKVDRAHILNAIARIPQALFLSQAQKDRLQAKARGIYLKYVKYNSKKANSFNLILNKLAAAVHAKPSMAKKMDRWYEDPNFYAAENMSVVSKAVNIISGLLGKCEIQCLNDLRIFKPSWSESLSKYLENYLQDPKNKTKFDRKTEIQKVTVLVMAGFEWVKSYCEDCFTKPQLG